MTPSLHIGAGRSGDHHVSMWSPFRGWVWLSKVMDCGNQDPTSGQAGDRACLVAPSEGALISGSERLLILFWGLSELIWLLTGAQQIQPV